MAGKWNRSPVTIEFSHKPDFVHPSTVQAWQRLRSYDGALNPWKSLLNTGSPGPHGFCGILDSWPLRTSTQPSCVEPTLLGTPVFSLVFCCSVNFFQAIPRFQDLFLKIPNLPFLFFCEFDQTPGDDEGLGNLVCCSPGGCGESDTT